MPCRNRWPRTASRLQTPSRRVGEGTWLASRGQTRRLVPCVQDAGRFSRRQRRVGCRPRPGLGVGDASVVRAPLPEQLRMISFLVRPLAIIVLAVQVYLTKYDGINELTRTKNHRLIRPSSTNTGRYAQDEVGPLRGHLDLPATRYLAHARIGVVLSDRPDAGLEHLSITVANAMVDVVITADTKTPDVKARMVEFGGSLSCAKIRSRPEAGATRLDGQARFLGLQPTYLVSRITHSTLEIAEK